MMLIIACRNFANTTIKPLKQLAINADFVVLSIKGIQQYFNRCADANMSLRSPDGTGTGETAHNVCDWLLPVGLDVSSAGKKGLSSLL
jgi:hypothetical protein